MYSGKGDRVSLFNKTVTCKYKRVVPSRKSVYSGISKLISDFSYYFYVPFTVFSTLYFHAVLSMFHLLYYWLHSKTNAVNQTAIGQSNVQLITTENEKQYTLSTII